MANPTAFALAPNEVPKRERRQQRNLDRLQEVLEIQALTPEVGSRDAVIPYIPNGIEVEKIFVRPHPFHLGHTDRDVRPVIEVPKEGPPGPTRTE